MYDILELNKMLVADLQSLAKDLNIPKHETLKKEDLIYQILDQQAISPPATKEKATASAVKEMVGGNSKESKPESKSESKSESNQKPAKQVNSKKLAGETIGRKEAVKKEEHYQRVSLGRN